MPPSVAFMVVSIVLIVTLGRILGPRVRDRRFGHDHAAPAVDHAETARLRGEVQQLRERIQVLERVITDNHSSVDLDRRIESLRDR